MAGFKLEGFKGLRPKISPRLLEPTEATVARNLQLDSGDIDPLKEAVSVAALSLANSKSIYYYPNGSTPTWLSWQTDVDVARSPVEEDAYSRLYFTGAPDNPAAPTGSAKPKFTWENVAHTGAAPTPPRTWRYLGLPAPTVAPSVSAADPYTGILLGVGRLQTTELKATIQYAVGEQDSGAFPARQPWMEFNATSPETEMMWYGDNNGNQHASFVQGETVFSDVVYEILEVLDSNRVRVRPVPPVTRTVSLSSNDNPASRPSLKYTFTRGVTSGVAPKSSTVQFKHSGEAIMTLNWGSTTYLRAGFRLKVRTAGLFGYHNTQMLLPNGKRFYDKTPAEWVAPRDSFYTTEANVQVKTKVHHDVTFLASADGTATFDFDIQLGVSVLPGDFSQDELESRSYVYTYVSTFNEESPPSNPSPVVEVVNGFPASVSGMTAAPPPYNSYIDRYRLYRTATGLNTTEFLFVEEFAAGATRSESISTLELGDPVATTDFDPPPDELRGLVALPNGSMAGFVGNRVVYSEPYQVHAWPYTKYLDAQVVGIAAFADSLLAVTDRTPYILSGAHPRTVGVRKLSLSQPCIAKRGIATVGDTVVYPSPDGLVAVNSSGASIITSEFMTKREWQALPVASIRAAVLDGVYHGFHDTGVIIFDPASGTLTTSDVVGEAPTYDPLQDEMFYLNHAVSSGQNVLQWGGAPSTYKTATWTSGILRAATPINLSCARVVADAYPVTLTLNNTAGAVATATVASGDPFRLPAGYLDTEFQVTVVTTSVVRLVHLAESMDELADG